jgi:hypothetical protein
LEHIYHPHIPQARDDSNQQAQDYRHHSKRSKEIHHSNALGGKLQNLVDSKLSQLQLQDSYKSTLLGNTSHRKIHLPTDSRKGQVQLVR